MRRGSDARAAGLEDMRMDSQRFAAGAGWRHCAGGYRARILVAFLVGGGLVVAGALPAGAQNNEVAIPEQRLYVANQASASVSVIDAQTGGVLHTVDLTQLGYGLNSRPHDTAVDPDGRHWYVSLIGGGDVLKFNAAHELVARTPFETPGLLSVHSESGMLFVGRSMMAPTPPQRIGAIDRGDMSVLELDVFFPRPHALAVDARTDLVYAASLVENRIAVLDPASDDLRLVDVAGPPHTIVQFALSPDGSRLAATTQLTGKLMVFDTRSPDFALVAEIDVGAQPWHPVYSPDGDRVYFGAKDDDEVVVVDARSWSVEKRISAPGIVEPHGSAVSLDGRYLFVSNRNQKGTYTPRRAVENPADVGTVVKIDTETWEVVQTIEVGAYPAGISLGRAAPE